MGKIRWSDRYDSLFQYWAQVHEMPWRVLKSQAFAESNMNPDAVSSAGAMGLAQFMKATAKEQGVADPMDPEEAIRGMAKYDVKQLTNVRLRLHEGGDLQDVDELTQWRLAVCAYNCGWAYVKTALQQLQTRSNLISWDSFKKELGTVEYNGKRPIVTECLPYAEKVIRDASVLLP